MLWLLNTNALQRFLLSTHNIHFFHKEIRKICGYLLLSGAGISIEYPHFLQADLMSTFSVFVSARYIRKIF